ncbi:class I SAM-dependent methyltransferase [Streptomyces sp. NPDC056224]|uniref:class I SAM-dependent methyltransferase n=1 Tax=Streptomyces sp. NPDC056224 TaxID=3345750 RepID=UPI0035D53D95
MPTAPDSRYADELGRTNPSETARLRALTDALDADTLRRLDAVGPAPGARVLEVGAGTGTVAAWLASRCPRGLITATDLDTTHLPTGLPGHVRVLRHDVTRDPFPAESFDLIHARCVLLHLPERERVVERMRDWLAPGGTLLLEDVVHFPHTGLAPGDPVRRSVEGICALLADSYGMEPDWGLRAPDVLHRYGYEQIAAEIALPVFRKGAPIADFWYRTVAALAPRLRESGCMTEAGIGSALAALRDPDRVSFPLGVHAVRARRPPAAQAPSSERPDRRHFDDMT